MLLLFVYFPNTSYAADCVVSCLPTQTCSTDGTKCIDASPQTQKEATVSCPPGEKAVVKGGNSVCVKEGASSAPAGTPGSDMKLVNPLGATATIPNIIGKVISTFLSMVGAVALLVFIFGGVVYMTAGGSQKRIDLAKDTLKYAAIGLSIIMFAYAITNSFLYVIAG